MLVVGLTGGIGSGKSTVSKFFAERQVPIIDADTIAHQIILADEKKRQLIDYFGFSILNKNETLNRHQLRQLIFNDPIKKKWLEELLHPLIIKEIKKQLHELKADYCIVVIPLLVETGPYPFIDHILVVDAPEEKCLERSQMRDASHSEEIQKIIASQTTREQRLAIANEVIHNQNSLETLEQQVEKLHRYYLGLISSTTKP